MPDRGSAEDETSKAANWLSATGRVGDGFDLRSMLHKRFLQDEAKARNCDKWTRALFASGGVTVRSKFRS